MHGCLTSARTGAGRDCIVPEVSRNKNIGEKGVNMHGSTFNKYIAKQKWEERGVEGFGDMAYLTTDKYAAGVTQLAANATLWEGRALTRTQFQPGQVPACQPASTGPITVMPLKAGKGTWLLCEVAMPAAWSDPECARMWIERMLCAGDGFCRYTWCLTSWRTTRHWLSHSDSGPSQGATTTGSPGSLLG